MRSPCPSWNKRFNREQLIGLILSDTKFIDESEDIGEYLKLVRG